MSRIDSIHINNFKFFGEQEPIRLEGKHLLLYGENGSGKSCIYWALYTLFEASVKYDVEEIKKYFKNSSLSVESLTNIYSPLITEPDGTVHQNSFIKLLTTDDPPVIYNVSLYDTSISGNSSAIEINHASDFLSYKALYKFQDFLNSEPIDLTQIFLIHILPYVTFPSFDICRWGFMEPRSNALEMWNEILIGPGMTSNANGKPIQFSKHSDENLQFDRFCNHFENQMQDLIDFINVNAPIILKKLGYNIEFRLIYNQHTHNKKIVKYNFFPFKIKLIITSVNNIPVNNQRPQTFLNEAKITAVALAIRLSILKKRINEEAPDLLKFIVFDDVMISLDMNNRDRLMDYLLDPQNNYTKDYQLLFLTHDKNLYDFVASKIKRWDDTNNWVYKEMYVGKDDTLNKEFPVFIDSLTENIDKARRHFECKDYTACALYIRKELEKLVIERLPDEVKERKEGTFLPLKKLWDKMVDRYSALGITVSKDIKDGFEESKLLVLNPQAHHQDISLPVYRVEIEKAFDLIEKLRTSYPIPIKTILVSKGMQCIFTHPSFDYRFEFEFAQDFIVDNLNEALAPNNPNCKVIYWEFETKPYWNLKENKEATKKSFELKLQKIIDILTTSDTVPAGITRQIISDNTAIINSIWSLKDVLTKANIEL